MAFLVSLILPAYNPGPVLEQTWKELLPFALKKPNWEFVFVCDGCTDGSDRQLKQWIVGHRNMQVVSYARNLGKGYALRVGMRRAKGAYRIFTDIDLAYPLPMVETIAEQLLAGCDVAIASRAHPESQIDIAGELKSYMRMRSLQSYVLSYIVKVLLGIRQRDPQAGLKGFSPRAARLLAPLIKSVGFSYDCELLVACRFFGIHVREVPIHVRYEHAHSTTRLKRTLQMAAELMQIRRRWRRIGKQGLPASIFSLLEGPGSTAHEISHEADPLDDTLSHHQRG